MRKVLIATRSGFAFNNLSSSFRNSWKVYTETNGTAVCNRIKNDHPDALILDLRLPGKDGLQILKDTFPHIPPVVLVLTDYTSPYLSQTLTSFGVDCILLTPFCPEYVRHLIDDMYESKISPPTKTIRHLKALGIDPRLTGYRCLITAIANIYNDPTKLIKEVYPETAKECGLSDGRCVEHTIRTAIRKAWLNRDPLIWAYYFPLNRNDDVDLPANKQFISAVAKHI